MEDFHHLRVYQDCRAFTRDVWRATRALPWTANKLIIQLDDACESIGANIAEGVGRKDRHLGNAELIRYGHFSYGSANEADHRLGGLHDRELISDATYSDLDPRLQDIKRKLRLWTEQLYRRDRGPTRR